MQHPTVRKHEIEAYWGTSDGTLKHGTIEVVAGSMREALEIARSGRLMPESREGVGAACARPEYFENHYDVEPIGDEYAEIRRENNLLVALSSMGLSVALGLDC